MHNRISYSILHNVIMIRLNWFSSMVSKIRFLMPFSLPNGFIIINDYLRTYLVARICGHVIEEHLTIILFKVSNRNLDIIKDKALYYRFKEPLGNTASLKKFEFLHQFSKALRKLDHVLLWILSTNTGLWQCTIC